MARDLNLNVGILGHVDSGKTSLARVLSEIASTACFDKNPQSQSRGITLDLGFSSFSIPVPDRLNKERDCGGKIQYTLVDCPGHASLIRTIIGGAQIIDMMLLVIDVTKGIQTQTAECLIIGELLCDRLIVVLNKVDLIAEDKRDKSIEKITKKLQLTLKTTKFTDCPIVNTAACPNADSDPIGIKELIETISGYSFIPERKCEAPFLFAVDHCFGIKGHGTVMTGTVLQGTVQINDEIEIPSLNLRKKVKSMQMFKKPASVAFQGDRVGICVTQFDPKLLERGIACFPNYASFANVIVINVTRIRYFKTEIKTKSKFHVTIGHETSIATITCISRSSECKNFDIEAEYDYENELPESSDVEKRFFLILEFDKPVLVVPNCTVIGSKLDMDIQTNSCRLAFAGTLLEFSKDKDYKINFLPKIKVYKTKQKVGIVERYVNDNEIIVKNLFKKETNVQLFTGLNVTICSNGIEDLGRIEGTFGQSGKVKVYSEQGFTPEIVQQLKEKGGGSNKSSEIRQPIEVFLNYKHNVYNVKERIKQ